MRLKLIKNRIFGVKTSRVCHLYTQRYNGRHYVKLRNMTSTSGLSILMHGFIPLPDAKSCDKNVFAILFEAIYSS